MDRPRKIHKRSKEEYRMRTHLIHGNYESRHWDYDHHVIPPISSSATYRLSSSHRGAQGFLDFGTLESHHKQGSSQSTSTTGWTSQPVECWRKTWPMRKAAKWPLHLPPGWRQSRQPLV